MGSTDLSFKGSDPGDIVWYNSAGSETERIWSQSGGGSLNYRTNAGSTYSLIHSGNYSSYALPLTGGTLTGGITINSNRGGYLGADGIGIYIQTGSHWLRCGDGGCDYDGQGIIHAGNISSQSVNYATSAGNSDTLDSVHLITQVSNWNTDNTSIFKSSESSISNAPTTGFIYGTTLRFHRSNTTYYTDLVVDLYNDRMFFRRKADGSYGSWRELIHSGNIGSQSVNYASSAGNADTVDGYHISGLVYGSQYGTAEEEISDCNSVSRTGFFTSSNFSNRPSEVSNWGSLMNIRLYDDNNLYHRQLFFDCYGSNKIWTRSDSGGSWTGWKQLAFTSDIPSTISWSNVTSKPSTFTPSSHTHSYSQITDGTSSSTSSGWSHILSNTYNGSQKSIFYMCHGGGYGAHLRGYSTSSSVYMLEIYNSSSQVFAVWGDGHANFAGSVYSNSDRHLKKNISRIGKGSLGQLFNISDKLLKRFTWKQSNKASYGFIAQELEQYIPEAVSENMTTKVKSVSYDIAYAKLFASLINEIKKLKAQVKSLMDDK